MDSRLLSIHNNFGACAAGGTIAVARIDDLLNISLGLSEAVLSQNKWPNALRDLADGFGGSFATFEVIDKKTGVHIEHRDSSDLEIQARYLKHFMPINPRFAFGSRADAPSIMHDAQFMSEQEMNRSEFYADFLRPHDLRYFLGYRAFETNDLVGVFTVQKSRRSKPPTDEDLLALGQLAPSLSRIADSQLEYGRLFADIQNLEDVFEGSKDGLLILDSKGSVRKMNSAAESIVQRNDGISMFSGKVVCGDATRNEQLARLVFLLSRSSSLEISESTLLVQRSSNLPPYQIRLQRCWGDARDLVESPGTLIMVIQDPDQTRKLEVLALMDSFGLTQTEAAVAILIAEGQAAAGISTSLNVSLHTIRTHIQRIMQKMGVTRQIDVVRILTRYM